MSDYDYKSKYYDQKKLIEEQQQRNNYLANRYKTNKGRPPQNVQSAPEKSEDTQPIPEKSEDTQPIPVTPPTQRPDYTPSEEVRGQKLSKENQVQFEEAIALYKKGLEGDSDAVKKSYEILNDLNSTYPDNTLTQAYFGCLTTLLGRDELDPNKRFTWVMKGLKDLDKAVAKEPNNVEIRNLRGHVCLRLPEIYFHRTSTAVEDFTHLVSRYEKDNSIMSEEMYYEILFDLGTAYKGINKVLEAQKIWDKLLDATKDPKYVNWVKRAGGRVKNNFRPEDAAVIYQKPSIDVPYYTAGNEKKNWMKA